MPPLNLKKIARDIQEKPDARRLFLLCEGTNTEPSFLEKVLTNANYIKHEAVSFIKVNKTNNDFGVTELTGLVRLANDIIADKDNHFSRKKDKIIIIFDLDRYNKKALANIKRIIEENKKNMIFIYTNPAVELFLLLCFLSDSYDKYIQPNIEAILANNWVTSSDGKTRRFLADLFTRVTGQDSKSATADFTVFSENVQDGINQEKMYCSQKISSLSKKLISNFGTILEKIKNNDFDHIEYGL